MKAIKIDDEIYRILQKLSQESGSSMKDLASKAIKAYYLGMQISDPSEAEIEKIEGRWISLKYPAKCSICGRRLEPGEIAFYEIYHYKDKKRRTRILCEACYYSERENDKQLLKLYLKKRQLKRILNQMEKQIEEYASQLEEMEIVEKIRQLYIEVRNSLRLMDGIVEDKNQLYELQKKIEALLIQLKEISEFVESTIIPKYIKIKKSRGKSGYAKY